MKRSSLALLTSLFVAPMAAYAQSVARVKQFSAQPEIESKATDEMLLAARSMVALKRLEKDVMVYRSLGEFEAHGKLARVSYQAFRNDLTEVTAEVEPMLARLPQSKLKAELTNALDSYRDGEFWWQKIDRPRVVNVSALATTRNVSTPGDTAFADTIPYTVTIHWRQANRYLRRAQQLMSAASN